MIDKNIKELINRLSPLKLQCEICNRWFTKKDLILAISFDNCYLCKICWCITFSVPTRDLKKYEK